MNKKICKICHKPIEKFGYLQFILKHPICSDCMKSMQKNPEISYSITQNRYCTMDSS